MEVQNMKVRFDFNLNAWMRGVEVEADSYDEAVEKLYKMSLSDLLEKGYDDESDISDIDGEIVEKNLKVKAYDIEYDIEEDDFENKEEYIQLINSLPEELTVDVLIEIGNYSEELAIAEEITYRTDYEVKDFKYMIIEEY